MKIIGIEDQVGKKQKKLFWSIIIGIIILILLVMICLYVGHKPFRNFVDKYILMKNVTENHVNSISLEESENYGVYAYDKYISIFKQNILTGYNSSGKQEYELTIEITNPIVDVNNRFLLIAEEGKQKIYLISGSNILWTKDLEGNISRISVNKNGYVSVVLTGTTHKSVIQTFDPEGNEMFKTYLSSSIAMDTDISYDNKYLSFAEISSNGTSIQSMIKTISIQKAQETPSDCIISTITCPSNSAVLNLKYQDQNQLVCMYDNSIHIIENNTSEEILKLEENERKIVFADMELNSFAFRIIERGILLNTESTIELLNTGNRKMNQYTIDSVVKEIYDYGDVIALNLGSEVHFIGTNGWLIKKYTSSQEVRKIVMNSHFAGIVYRDKIEIIEL